MPAYGDLPAGVGATTAGPTSLAAGESLALWNNETVTPGAPTGASIVLARAESPSGSDQGITFFLEFAAAPTSSVQILGSNKALGAVFNANDWVTLTTSTNKQTDSYTDTGRYAYYCVYVASQSAGGKFTALAQR